MSFPDPNNINPFGPFSQGQVNTPEGQLNGEESDSKRRRVGEGEGEGGNGIDTDTDMDISFLFQESVGENQSLYYNSPSDPNPTPMEAQPQTHHLTPPYPGHAGRVDCLYGRGGYGGCAWKAMIHDEYYEMRNLI